MSDLEETLLFQIKAAGLPEPVREYAFAKSIGRKWRFDLCWPDLQVAVEVEGGTWSRGRHTTGQGFKADCEKYNQASMMHWLVLRFTSDMISSGMALQTIERVMM